MVSSLLSCWPVRVRLASRPGLLLLLREGNDGDNEDGEVANNDLQPVNLGHEDECNPAANNDLQPPHADINLLTPAIVGQNNEKKGFDPVEAAADNLDLHAVGLLLAYSRHEEEQQKLTTIERQRKIKGLDPAAAEKGLDPKPTKKGQITAENQGFHTANKGAFQPNHSTIGRAIHGDSFPFSYDNFQVAAMHAASRVNPRVKKKMAYLFYPSITVTINPGIIIITEITYDLGSCYNTAFVDLVMEARGLDPSPTLQADICYAVAGACDIFLMMLLHGVLAISEWFFHVSPLRGSSSHVSLVKEVADAALADKDVDMLKILHISHATIQKPICDNLPVSDAAEPADPAEDAAIEFTPDEDDAASAAAGALSFPPIAYTVSDDAESAYDADDDVDTGVYLHDGWVLYPHHESYQHSPHSHSTPDIVKEVHVVVMVFSFMLFPFSRLRGRIWCNQAQETNSNAYDADYGAALQSKKIALFIIKAPFDPG